MSRILASRLDFCRDACDKAFRDLVANMRGRMRKRSDASTEAMENAIKWLPEELEHWAQTSADWTPADFEASRWCEFAIVDWLDPKNKLRVWANAHTLLKKEEQEMMSSWKRSASQ